MRGIMLSVCRLAAMRYFAASRLGSFLRVSARIFLDSSQTRSLFSFERLTFPFVILSSLPIAVEVYGFAVACILDWGVLEPLKVVAQTIFDL